MEQRDCDPRKDKFRFGPDLTNLLAEAYLATGDTSQSVQVRIRSAEKYMEAGDSTAVRKVLAPIDAQQIERVRSFDRRRLETLHDAVGRFDKVDPGRIERIQRVAEPAPARGK